VQQAAPQAQQAPAAAGGATTGRWSEHVDKGSGKTYYYNTMTKAPVYLFEDVENDEEDQR